MASRAVKADLKIANQKARKAQADKQDAERLIEKDYVQYHCNDCKSATKFDNLRALEYHWMRHNLVIAKGGFTVAKP